MTSRDPADYLLPSERLALERMCETLGIRWRGWRSVSWVRHMVESLAVQRLAEELDDVGRACARLGVNEDTHRRRLLRACNASEVGGQNVHRESRARC